VDAARRTGTCRQWNRASDARVEVLVWKLLRPQELQQPEEPVRVVYERRGAQEQDVPAKRGNRGYGAPGSVAGVAGWPFEVLCLVHHEQVDPGAHSLRGELRTLDQHLQRDHRAAMDVERVEVRSEVADNVSEAVAVE